MAKHGKKYTSAKKQVVAHEVMPLAQALTAAKSLAYAKFDETVDVHVNLGIDSEKGEQVVRGSVVLPHGRGRTVKVLVFAKGDHADAARKAGADYVGVEDLIEKINGGWIDFDFAVATPDLMGTVGQLAKVLGPKGLLPNKKVGTVTFDVATVVR
ncbi:MAG TPA: 50S ribosomal protein L1, partial [Candidatus Limnocylindria bacterium]|nr:50S ribosomal protein L1 [Candidatus Limnocylindria bacterium]